MTSLTLHAQQRSIIGKAVDGLRRQRKIPAVVYGHNIPSMSVEIDAGLFDAMYKKAGSTSLIDVVINDAAPVKALIHAIQRHPTTGRVLHADLYQVQMTEKLEASIELNFIGESPAVKEQGGIFIRALDAVKVSCLPSDLVSSIDVDMGLLKTFEDRLHVGDLVVPAGITILDKPEEVVASVTPPRSEAEIASLSEKVEENVESVEVAKKAKADEEVAEGEAAPAK
jgi:large subunit ribosomal protein L25